MNDENISGEAEAARNESEVVEVENVTDAEQTATAVDETVGTGSFIAVSCSLMTLAVLLIAIAIFMIRQAT